MTTGRVRMTRSVRLIVACTLVGSILSCTEEPAAAPRAITVGSALAAKPASGSVGVSSASPTFGDQGTTIDVHVFGSGFAAGAQATWLLHGAADPVHVRTNTTTVVSSTELVANITIASDATLDFWDVQVALASGKNGVGSELFEVTSAQILGPGTTGGDAWVYGMSQNLQVVGYGTGGSSTSAFVYDDASGMVNLGGGQAWGIDPQGTMVLGRDANFIATAWVQQSPSTWVAEQFPRLPFSVGGNVMAAVRTSDGTLLVAGFDDSATSTKPNAAQTNRPVLWQRTGSSWSAPQRYTLPAGSVRGALRAINALGQAAGRIDAGPTGAVWENPTTPTRLDGIPNAINVAGTLVIGDQAIPGSSTGATIPVYWWRDPATGWSAPKALPSIAGASCPSGTAHGLNSAGVVVGNSCNAAGKTQATVWRLDLSGPTPVLVAGPTALPGLGTGPKTSAKAVSTAISVSEASPFTVAGMALNNGINQLAVRWHVVIQ